jgi:nicotinamidase-related amidase
MTQSIVFPNSQPFLDYLSGFQSGLPSLPLNTLVDDPQHIAIICVDVTNGFCHEGQLASPRVKGIIAPIVSLFEKAWSAGVRHILLPQDTHEPQAVEFGQFPPHCVRGTAEAETVPEIKALPYYEHMVVMEKNSIHSGMNTHLNAWIAAHPEVDTFIVVGDCTDLCTYQLAMHLRLEANARQLQRRVVVPADCVDTYDMPVDLAQKIGALPHDADLLHAVFLYHMALNGVDVVSRIE